MNISDYLLEMEGYAKVNNIPIMVHESIDYITSFIKENNIKSVLEIGTAIAYSTIKISLVSDIVTSIERDNDRFSKAVENVSKCDLNNKITLINDDAFNVKVNNKFDMILIDAAKGKNMEFIEKFKSNLKSEGFIIIDNINFHGLVGKSVEIKSRNLRSLVRKIEKFLSFLDNQSEFNVSKINVGDGLIILERRK